MNKGEIQDDNLELVESTYGEVISGIKVEWLNADYAKWYSYITKLPSKFQVTYLVVLLDNQVFNGGFHQYYINSYGLFSTETIRALEAIGAKKRAIILENAFKLVNKDNDSDSVFRRRIFNKTISSLVDNDNLHLELDALDTLYYDEKGEDIVDLLATYIKTH
ncbi:DMP19 family protein [Chryseobacterium sp. 22543]|uniref:DMP19 family protein n=1 Tax=Chryseobacterium sp. 22543 TaxID=3453940 RepID=UPI003F875D8E